MYPNSDNTEPSPGADSRRRANRDTAPAATSSEAATAVLERITLPQEAIERINELISPGSSLIVSDEVANRETGNGTDFVVLMSGDVLQRVQEQVVHRLDVLGEQAHGALLVGGAGCG
jgi:hypothetical protein